MCCIACKEFYCYVIDKTIRGTLCIMNFKAQIILTLSNEFSRYRYVMSKSSDENADVIFNILESVNRKHCVPVYLM